MPKASRTILTACGLLLALTTSTRADIVYLTNGQKVEGEVTDLGGSIRVRKTSGITVVYPKSKVLRIERRASAAEEYRKRREAVESDDAEDLFSLARWCAKGGLDTEAEAAFREVLGIASPVYRKAKKDFAQFLERKERLKEALSLYDQLGNEAIARRSAVRARLERLRAAAFHKAEERLARQDYREAVGALEHAFSLTPEGGASGESGVTEADVLARLSEARKLLADSFASSRFTIKPCPACAGAGAVICGTCNGKGQVQREFLVMDPAGGVRKVLKWVRCDTCRGGKKVRCGLCRGVTADIEGFEGNLRNSLRLLADRAFDSIGSSADRGMQRIHTWVLKNPLIIGEGAPAYAKSDDLRKLVKSIPPSRKDLAALKGPWKAADAEKRANFLACYGLEIAKVVAMVPQSAMKPDRKRKPVPLDEAQPGGASYISAFPEMHSGGAFRIAGVWKGARKDPDGAPRMNVDIEADGPHSLRPFMWTPEAKELHANLGSSLGLAEMRKRATSYGYGEIAKVAALRAEGDRVEILGRFYYDDKPVPDWRFEVWSIAMRPDEEMEKAIALLSQRVTFRFEKTPISAGLAMLTDLTGVPFDSDLPKGLDMDVSARVKELPLGRALVEMLKPVELVWSLADGRVKVAAEASARDRERTANILKLLPTAKAP